MRIRPAVAWAVITLGSLWLLSESLGSLYQYPSLTGHTMLVGLAAVVVGFVARLLPWEAIAMRLLAWLAAGAAAVAAWWWLHRDVWEVADWRDLARAGIETIDSSVAPATDDGTIAIFAQLGIVTLWLIIELIVQVWRRAGLAVIPLTGWYVAFCFLPLQAGLRTFATAVAVLAAILIFDSWMRAQRWSRHRYRGSARPWVVGLVGVIVAASVAWTAGEATDVRAPQRSGDESIVLANPSLDLRNGLSQPERTPILRYRTAGSAGVHLRLAVLEIFDTGGWRQAGFRVRDLPPTLDAAPGLTATGLPKRTTRVTTTDLTTMYLPVPYSPTRIEVPGEWRYHGATQTIYRADGDDTSAQLAYEVTSVDINPTPEQLRRSGPAVDKAQTIALPAGLPDSIVQLSHHITSEATTSVDKLAAIQTFLRSSEFTYSLTEAPAVGGMRGLEEFLLSSRTGYCEQFAAAMAVMARVEGFHSRVVIGFTPGERVGADIWSVTNQNLHAWPEIYLNGWGWVRYEPTPAVVSGAAPDYAPEVEVGDPDATASPTPSASASPSARTTARPTTPQPSAQPTPTGPGGDSGVNAAVVAGWIGGALGILALGGSPALVRWARRRRRFAGPDFAAGAWAEVRDTVWDLRHEWPADTPRRIADALDLRGDAARDLAVLAAEVERQRFAAGHPAGSEATAKRARAVRRALLAEVETPDRITAALIPASLWRGWRSSGS